MGARNPKPTSDAGLLQSGCCVSNRFDIANRNNGDVFTSALEQTGKHTAWPELDEQIAAKIDQSFHAIDPADCAGDLILQRLANFRKCLNFAPGHVADHWKLGDL